MLVVRRAALSVSLICLFLSLGCSTEVDSSIDLVHDACAPLVLVPEEGTRPTEQDAIDMAIDLWNGRAGTLLSRGDGGGLPVVFDEAGLAFRGLYDDENGIVFVNRRLEELEPMSITVAHEVGHAFGLTHVDRDERPSVMN